MDSKSSVRKDMRVQVPPPVLLMRKGLAATSRESFFFDAMRFVCNPYAELAVRLLRNDGAMLTQQGQRRRLWIARSSLWGTGRRWPESMVGDDRADLTWVAAADFFQLLSSGSQAALGVWG